MKTFKKFLESVGYNVPVVSIERRRTSLNRPETLRELNKNLSIALSVGFPSVGNAVMKARKILSMYGIELPKIEDEDMDWSDKEGTFSTLFHFRNVSGEKFDGSVDSPDEEDSEYKLILKYKLNGGKYDVSAEVKAI
jgi:hypothetical protein